MAYRDSIHEDRSFRGVKQAGNQRRQRRFSGPGCAHNGNGPAGGNMQVNVFENREAVVGECEVTELDFTFKLVNGVFRDQSVINGRLGSEDGP